MVPFIWDADESSISSRKRSSTFGASRRGMPSGKSDMALENHPFKITESIAIPSFTSEFPLPCLTYRKVGNGGIGHGQADGKESWSWRTDVSKATMVA